MHRLFNALLYFLSGFMPRNPRKLVFGAWLGRKFSDNPKYLLLYLAGREPGLDLVWIADNDVHAMIPAHLPVRFVRRGSPAACWERLTAGACFVTHAYADLGTYNLMRGARRVYLGHGLAIKHMGSKDHVLRNPLLAALRRVLRRSYSFDHYIASSPAHREKLLVENATNNIVPGQVVACGQPRVDFLLENSGPDRAAGFRARFLAEHGIPPARHVITYLPTFRDKGTPVFSFSALESGQRERLDELLARLDAVLLEKSHFAEARRDAPKSPARPARVFALSGSVSIDTQELLLTTDLLITDYSGVYLDYLLLDRPIIHFAYDLQYYTTSDRGLYFEFREVAAGPVVETFESLCASIKENLTQPASGHERREKMRTSLMGHEIGEACQSISRKMLRLGDG